MNTKWMAASLLSLCVAGSSFAQKTETKPKEATEAKQEKKESQVITIRKNGNSKEKMTIVVDGDKVTVNGKPVDELKDGNVQVIRGARGGYTVTAPPAMGRAWVEGQPATVNGNFFGNDLFMTYSSNKAVLGVSTEKDEKGAKITEVSKESAAEKAGLKKDDIIIKVGDTKIENAEGLYKAVGKYNANDKVVITYLRDGKENSTTATLAKSMESSARTLLKNFNGNSDFNFQMPKIAGTAPFAYSYSRKPRLGLQIQDTEDGKGVKILDVDEESLAAKAGLKKDDVITDIEGKEVKNVDDLRTNLKDMKEGDSFKIKYKRDGKVQNADLKFPKKLKTAEL